MRTPAAIGGLWPLCKFCKHIAQAHPENGEHICGESVHAPCPTCGTYQDIPCQCREYVGPSRAEFALMIQATLEEIERYGLN